MARFMLILIVPFFIAMCSAESNKMSKLNKLNDLIFHLILGDGLTKTTKMAFDSCQKQFQWDRWNCPHNDFLNKRSTQKLDREAAFVQSISFAASILFILANCSNIENKINSIDHQRQDIENGTFTSIDPIEFNGKIINYFLQLHKQTRLDIFTYAKRHNERAAWIAVRELMQKNYGCNDLFNSCVGQSCLLTSNDFSSISTEIRKMYDRSVLLSYNNNGQIDSKAKEDSLVFTYDSPNYCKENAISGWQGTVGRQCSRNKNLNIDLKERRSCQHLCRSCGHRIRRKQVQRPVRCNCKFEWCCNVTCDICYEYTEQHYCY